MLMVSHLYVAVYAGAPKECLVVFKDRLYLFAV